MLLQTMAIRTFTTLLQFSHKENVYFKQWPYELLLLLKIFILDIQFSVTYTAINMCPDLFTFTTLLQRECFQSSGFSFSSKVSTEKLNENIPQTQVAFIVML